MTVHSVLIQKLLSTNAQLGRRVTGHHLKPFVYGSRNAASVIDPDRTLVSLRTAASFLSSLSLSSSRILFVNTNPLADPIVSLLTRTLGFKSPSSWKLSGFLTNSRSPKKFRSRSKKMHLLESRPPDCVVVMDCGIRSSVVFEADRLGIPIVGMVDAGMPWEVYRRITYPVPANDSVKFLYLFCNLVTKTVLARRGRLGGRTRWTRESTVTRVYVLG